MEWCGSSTAYSLQFFIVCPHQDAAHGWAEPRQGGASPPSPPGTRRLIVALSRMGCPVPAGIVFSPSFLTYDKSKILGLMARASRACTHPAPCNTYGSDAGLSGRVARQKTEQETGGLEFVARSNSSFRLATWEGRWPASQNGLPSGHVIRDCISRRCASVACRLMLGQDPPPSQ